MVEIEHRRNPRLCALHSCYFLGKSARPRLGLDSFGTIVHAGSLRNVTEGVYLARRARGSVPSETLMNSSAAPSSACFFTLPKIYSVTLESVPAPQMSDACAVTTYLRSRRPQRGALSVRPRARPLRRRTDVSRVETMCPRAHTRIVCPSACRGFSPETSTSRRLETDVVESVALLFCVQKTDRSKRNTVGRRARFRSPRTW